MFISRAANLLLIVLSLQAVNLHSSWAATEEEEDQDEDRASSISTGFSFGPDRYISENFGLGIGLSPDWLMTGSIGHSSTNLSAHSLDARLGADWDATEDFSWSFSIVSKYEPDAVITNGLSSDLTWTFSELWEGERVSALSIGGETLLNRPLSSNGGKNKSSLGFLSGFVTLGLSQELSDTFDLSATIAKYFYSGNLGGKGSLALSGRGGASSSLFSNPSDAPDFQFSATMSWQPFERWSFDLTGGSSTSSIDQSRTASANLSITWNASDHWNFSTEFTGLADASTPTQMNDRFISVGLGYQW